MNFPGDSHYLKKIIRTPPSPPTSGLAEKRCPVTLGMEKSLDTTLVLYAVSYLKKLAQGGKVFCQRCTARSEMEQGTGPQPPSPTAPAAHHTDKEEEMPKDFLESSWV